MKCELDWNAIKRMVHPRLEELGVPAKLYRDDVYQLSPNAFARAHHGGDVAGVLWVSCEEALRRFWFGERVFLTGPTGVPPDELLLAPGCVRYDEMLAKANTLVSSDVRNWLSSSLSSQSPPDAYIGVDNLDFRFRAEHGLDPTEKVYAIAIRPNDKRWLLRTGAMPSELQKKAKSNAS